MADSIQNVRIKFVSDTAGLTQANTEFQKLTATEQILVKGFQDLNAAVTKVNEAIVSGAKKSNTESEKTVGIINNLKQNIQQLQAARDKSNDPSKIKIYNEAIASQNAKLKNLTSSTDELNKKTGALNNTFKGLGTTIIAAFSFGAIVGFGKQILDITAQFEKLRAVLTNTLGSQSLADSALNKIKNLAATTNFGVLELTNAYVKLANSGFEPTTKDLLALADLTNSTGKSFDQLAEAILDANTDQFIRLKEFGIKASREGDKISFLFKGVRTEVDRNSASITKYLISLGNIPGVMGATAAISQTVTGKISNLGDAYDFLLNTIGSQQSGFFKAAIQGLTDFTNFLNSTLRSVDQFNERLIDNASLHKQNQLNGYLKEERALIGDNADEITKFNKVKAAEFSEAKASNEAELIQQKEKLALLNAEFELAKKAGDFESEINKNGTRDIDVIIKERKKLNEEIILTNGSIKAQEQIIHDLENENKQIGIAEQERLRLQQEAYEKGKAKREKAFNDAKSELDQAEANAVRRAKLEGQTDASIIGIQQEFNNKREILFQEHNKAIGADYESLILRTEELEQELTAFQKNQIEVRKLLDLTIQSDRLLAIDLSLVKQKSRISAAQNDLLEIELRRYQKGEINKEQYEENIAKIENDFHIKSLQSEIIVDQEKLRILEAGSFNRANVEQDLFDKKKELLELEVEANAKAEKEKEEQAKQRAARIKQIENQAFNTATSIISNLFQIGQNNRDAEYQDIEIQKKNELALVGDNKAKQAAINQKYTEKENALKLEQAKADKNQALFNAGLGIAEGVIKALTVAPPLGFVLAALVAAAGAVQLATIQSKPLPKFFDGTDSLQLMGNPDGRDTIPIMANKGERIVPTAINEHLKGIPNSELPRLAEMYRKMDYKGITQDILSGHSGGSQEGALLTEIKSMNKKLDTLKVANINIDKNGIHTFMETKNSKVEFVNNYFRN